MDVENFLSKISTNKIKLGLLRTKEFLKFCNNPEKNYSIIQVAGTNGKGSTSAIIAKILYTAKYKVGLFTSPHLYKINERIRINGVPISDFQIKIFIKKYQNYINTHKPTFFETITCMAFWYFHKKNVDIAVMETGLGGRLDSVSACTPELIVFTKITRDHTEILGNTLKKIAIEKAGAIKQNCICVSSPQKKNVKHALEQKAQQTKSSIYYTNPQHSNYKINLNGTVQKENCTTAIKAISMLKGFKINKNDINKALLTINWPGRNQIIQTHPLIVFDVAHNEDGINQFLKFINTQKITGMNRLIISLQNNKKITQKTSKKILSTYNYIYCVEPDSRNPMKSTKIKNIFKNHKKVLIKKDVLKTFKKVSQQTNPEDSISIIGTHYFGPYVNKFFKICFDKI